MMRKLHCSTWVLLGILVCMLLINLLARCSSAFSDFYTGTIFPYLSAPWVRLSGIVPFSVGEILIIIGLVILLLAPVVFVLLMIRCKASRRKIIRIYGKVFGWILAYILATETLHCFIMYQCTPFGQRYYPDAQSSYSTQEVLQVYETLVLETNAAAKEVARDQQGHFILTDDLQQEAKLSMQLLGETYPQFSGYYPDAKPIANSFFMTQQWLLGIYFPFTMEANYNPDVYPVNLPNTFCHEFTHLKGNIFEDEAGFLAFLACIGSESADFRYSGYISALEYMLNESFDFEGAQEITDMISAEVWTDLFTYVPEEYWTENADKEVIDTAIVDEVSSIALDTTLKLNGVADGKQSYSRIVNLLLAYYLN